MSYLDQRGMCLQYTELFKHRDAFAMRIGMLCICQSFLFQTSTTAPRYQRASFLFKSPPRAPSGEISPSWP